MATRSKRKTARIKETNYCRRCQETKDANNFFSAVNFRLDTNNRMSICKDCVGELYEEEYIKHRTLNKTILSMCRLLDVEFDETIVDSVRGELDRAVANGRKPKPPFSAYKGRLTLARGAGKGDIESQDLTFHEPKTITPSQEDIELTAQDTFWGDNLDQSSIDFLEKEYANFKRSYKIDTYSKKVLLKRVCFKLLDIKLAQESGDAKSIPPLEKSLLGLMKDLAISPAHSNAASSGESAETFGVFIKEIEEKEPAQWLEEDGRPFYEDVDDIEYYYDTYFVRPLRNFITGNADYDIPDVETYRKTKDAGIE